MHEVFTFFLKARIFLSISGTGSCEPKCSPEFDGAIAAEEFVAIFKSFNSEVTTSTAGTLITSSPDATLSLFKFLSTATC